MEQKKYNHYPAVILLLVACLVALAAAYVGKSSQVAKQVAASQQDQQKFVWQMVTTWPKNFPGLGMAPENFAKMIYAMSDGRLEVKVRGAGEIVPAMGVFDAVSLGNVEMGHGAAYYWGGKVKGSAFFTSVPFGLTAQEMNAWLHYGGGQELWEEAYAPFNLIPLAGGNTGVQMAGWFNKEINSVDDLRGLKMRMPGLGGVVLNRVGGTAVTIPGGELYTSLQTGVIDATEWVGPYNDIALGLHEATRYYYYPGWHEPGPTLEMTVNKQAFESLPADLQAMVKVAARAVNQDMLDEYTARNNGALKLLLEKHGVQLRKLPDDAIAELRKVSEQVLWEQVEGDELAERIYRSYTEFRAGVANYHRLSEQAYLNTRDIQ